MAPDTVAERCALLRAIAGGIGERHLELAAVVSLETGKSRTESILEVQEAIDLITTYADHMEGNDGYVVPLASFVADERNTDVLRPYGVFAVIAPFNFPAALSIGMAASALIAGNTVVFKPSEETPWTGAILGEIARAAELPPGVFNLVHGGEATGRALVDAGVDGVAFTGSAAVGREIARKLQEGPYARPALTEMGGKNPAIVTATADLDHAAEGSPAPPRPRRAEVQRVLARDRDGRRARRVRRAPRRVDRAPAAGRPRRSRELVGARRRPASRRALEEAVPPRAATASWPRRRTTRSSRALRRAHRRLRPARSAIRWTRTAVPAVRRVTRVASLDEALAEANGRPTAHGGRVQRGPAELDRFLDEIQAGVVYVNRRAGATTGAWPGRSPSAAGNPAARPARAAWALLPRAVHARAEPDRRR